MVHQSINYLCSGGCGLRAMQLCNCKSVDSVHTQCIMPLAIISETFAEMVIINTNGASIN